MDEYFYSKLDNFIEKNQYCENGIMQYFLNPAEQYETESYLKTNHDSIDYILYGGYDFAERRMFVLNPITEIRADVKSVFIKGSGYHKLEHKDFMGAVLGLGIERRCIGDIIINENTAVVFVTDKIRDFLLNPESPLEYKSVGKDKVTVSDYIVPVGFNAGREYAGITGIVASARLDSVVSVLIKTSREKAKAIIACGNVQHNFRQEFNNDKQIVSGDIISVKGYGRFNISDLSQKTKKDKIKLIATKNI